jgi:hypothetical protein
MLTANNTYGRTFRIEADEHEWVAQEEDHPAEMSRVA